MKKTLLALAVVALSVQAQAGNQVQLLVKGLVPAVYDISIVTETAAANLDLLQQGNGIKVATLTEYTNSSQGYKVKAKSTNGGKLVNTSDQNSIVNYTMTYQGSQIALNSSPTQIHTTNQKGTFTKELKISYNQPSNLSAGSHEDTVQFTIEAN